MESLLRKGSDPIWVQKSFNTIETENIGYSQRGGTATVLNGALSKYIKDANVDHTGLGRWSWVKLEGQPGHVTRIVTAYGPCGSKSSGNKTYYQQQRRYIQNNSLRTTVKKMFRDNLCATLRKWRNQGNRIILMMDANNTVSDGQLSKALAEDGLEMKEAVHSIRRGPGPKTYFRGKSSIDGI